MPSAGWPIHAGNMHSSLDHQRTYESTPSLRETLLSFAGRSLAIADGQEMTITRGIGPLRVDRTLVTCWFDTADRHLHSRDAMLRCRGRKTGDAAPTKWKVEARLPSSDGMVRVSGATCPEPDLPGVDDAVTAVLPLVDGEPFAPVAFQTKTRHLLLAHRSIFGSLSPEFVIALDEVEVRGRTGPTIVAHRHEVELQIFTQLPWTRRVDPGRTSRFESFVAAMEEQFSLVPASVSSYQAVPIRSLA